VAQRGKTSIGWFFGFKVHFVINHLGEVLGFHITPGNTADNNQEVIKTITTNAFGKLVGDKGYICNEELFKSLYSKGIHLITKIRRNMKNKLLSLEDKLLLRKRGLIESVIGIFKNSLSIEHTRHRSSSNFLAHLCSTFAAYVFYNSKPSI
jgi:Transposase DDE domain